MKQLFPVVLMLALAAPSSTGAPDQAKKSPAPPQSDEPSMSSSDVATGEASYVSFDLGRLTLSQVADVAVKKFTPPKRYVKGEFEEYVALQHIDDFSLDGVKIIGTSTVPGSSSGRVGVDVFEPSTNTKVYASSGGRLAFVTAGNDVAAGIRARLARYKDNFVRLSFTLQGNYASKRSSGAPGGIAIITRVDWLDENGRVMDTVESRGW
jgi:hypothetical protein